MAHRSPGSSGETGSKTNSQRYRLTHLKPDDHSDPDRQPIRDPFCDTADTYPDEHIYDLTNLDPNINAYSHHDSVANKGLYTAPANHRNTHFHAHRGASTRYTHSNDDGNAADNSAAMITKMELKPFLKQLIAAPGLSGHELPVRRIIETAWKPLVDELHTSPLGSLHGLRRGNGSEPRPSLLIAAHMDAIGFMVTAQREGLLRLTSIGGIDARQLPGQLVTVHGREDLPGVIIRPPAHQLPEELKDKSVPFEHLWVDTGRAEQDVNRLVRVGDLISFAQEPYEFGEDFLVGHSLDNRASVAALTLCLEELQGRSINWDLWAVATAQEEETLGGAATSAFHLRPSLAVVVDVTFASGPGSPEHKTYPLGEGPTLGWGPNIHPALYDAFKELAERLEIPYSREVIPENSGTDVYALQVAVEGIPSMDMGIPLRYMHSPVEVVSLKDITRTGRLLAEFTAQLDASFMDKMTWVMSD